MSRDGGRAAQACGQVGSRLALPEAVATGGVACLSEQATACRACSTRPRSVNNNKNASVRFGDYQTNHTQVRCSMLHNSASGRWAGLPGQALGRLKPARRPEALSCNTDCTTGVCEINAHRTPMNL